MKNGSTTVNHNEVEFPTIKIAPNFIRTALTDLINEFIRIEKTIRGLEYQQHSFFERGQIDLLTSIIDDRWNNKETGRSYYEYLHYLVQKYSLAGVRKMTLNEFGDTEQHE